MQPTSERDAGRHVARAVSLAREVAFCLLRWSAAAWLARELFQRRRVTVLCYHRPEPADFDRHLRVLRRRYTIVSLRDYLDSRSKRANDLPVKPLIITLDDGHRLNYQLKSVLQGHRVPCVMFLCSGVTGTRRHFWFDTAMPAQDRELLKRLPDCERLARLDAMGFREEHEWADRTALTWEEVADLRGVADFQSHTVLHPVLPHCSDARSLDEIERSRTELERQLKSPVYAIAYPNGSYSERELAFVRRAGYECGLTLDFGLNGRDTSVFQLRRICMRDQGGSSEVIVRASGLWDALKQWFRSSPRLFAAGQRD